MTKSVTLWDRWFCMTRRQDASKPPRKSPEPFNDLAYLVWLPHGSEPSEEIFARAGRQIGHQVPKGTVFYWSLTKKGESGDWITRMKSTL